MSAAPQNRQERGGEWFVPPLVVFATTAYAVVAWVSMLGIDTQWDEATDLVIAWSLKDDPMVGNSDDPYQGRLPMYLTALALTFQPGLSHRSALLLSRTLSIIVSAASIPLAYRLARRWFAPPAPSLAAIVLAASPYFLGFGRMALTEGDAFCPTAVLASLLAFERFREDRTSPQLTALALALGIAAASKFLLAVVVPIIAACDFIDSFARLGDRREPTPIHRSWFVMTALAVVFAALATSPAWLNFTPFSVNSEILSRLPGFAWFDAFLLTLVPMAAGIWLGIRNRPDEGSRWPVLKSWLVIAPLSALVCLTFFPAHLLNPQLLGGLAHRTSTWGGATPGSGTSEAAWLYGGIVLFKLGIPLGLATSLGLVTAVILAPVRSSWRLLAAVIFGLTALYAALPVRQTFYLMSVYPLVIIALAGFVGGVDNRLARWQQSPIPRLLSRSALAVALIWLLVMDIRVYPAFGYAGYEVVDTFWLGRWTCGYRSIVQITNDGTEEALAWCRTHLPEGTELAACLSDVHVAEAEAARRLPKLTISCVDQISQDVINRYPYILIHHARGLGYNEFLPEFGDYPSLEHRYTVWRGRNVYRLPVVSVYRNGAVPETLPSRPAAPSATP